jgi:hypothetical protein
MRVLECIEHCFNLIILSLSLGTYIHIDLVFNVFDQRNQTILKTN